MTLRHILLAAGGLVVIVAAIYLAIEVRATPAAAQVATRSTPASPGASSANAAGAPTEDDPPAPAGSATSRMRPMPTPSSIASKSASTSPSSSGSAPSVPAAEEKLDEAKLKQVINDAYGAYDRQEFEEAKSYAARALAHDAKNVKALRIMVSTSCIEGNAVDAQKYFDQLPEGKDRADMRTRCGRDYNITFK